MEAKLTGSPCELAGCDIESVPQVDVRLNKETELCSISSFGDVRKFLSSIPSIGQGGCGIATLAMYRWLAINGQLCSDTKFAYLYKRDYEGDRQLAQNKAFIENGEGIPASCTHCVIFHNGILQDCNSLFTATDYGLTHMIDDVYFLISSINIKKEWNTAFNRKEEVPKIAKVLGINLDDITL